jgi:flavin-dependent dehydrogenase
VRYTLGEGAPQEVHARYVVDASGQAKILARKLNLLQWHEDLKNVAIWTYFQGGTHFEGIDRGNILTEHHPDGWMWVIPFSDGTRSVGFVGPHEEFTRTGLSPEEFFTGKLATSREAKQMLAGATRVADYRTTKDWSYHCTSFAGPGYLMAGDAAAFVDPLFSTGVMLAMKSAASAAETVDAILREPDQEAAHQEQYETGYREFFDTVVSFVRYFYDARRKRNEYWERAQELIDPVREVQERKDFVLLISGLGGARQVMETGAKASVPAHPAAG